MRAVAAMVGTVTPAERRGSGDLLLIVATSGVIGVEIEEPLAGMAVVQRRASFGTCY